MRKQACKHCKALGDGGTCAVCGGQSWSQSWQGRIVFLDTRKSLIAHKMGVKKTGEYALKVR